MLQLHFLILLANTPGNWLYPVCFCTLNTTYQLFSPATLHSLATAVCFNILQFSPCYPAVTHHYWPYNDFLRQCSCQVYSLTNCLAFVRCSFPNLMILLTTRHQSFRTTTVLLFIYCFTQQHSVLIYCTHSTIIPLTNTDLLSPIQQWHVFNPTDQHRPHSTIFVPLTNTDLVLSPIQQWHLPSNWPTTDPIQQSSFRWPTLISFKPNSTMTCLPSNWPTTDLFLMLHRLDSSSIQATLICY
jgi:hypothetical protein